MLSQCLLVALVLAGGVFAQEESSTGKLGKAGPVVATAKDFVSTDGRFKIKFPGEPESEVSRFGTTVIHDYKLTTPTTVWRVSYSEDPAFTDDEAKMKDAYAAGVRSVQKRERKLVYKKDIRLNGKLGIEYVLEEPHAVIITRSFMVGRRLYLVSAERRKASTSAGSLSPSGDVKIYLDSFNFWCEG